MLKLINTNKPVRHPDNNNLRLHYDKIYEGLPLMFDKGPFVREYLANLKRTIDSAMEEYARVLAFRVDLRLPQDSTYTNRVISRFTESFTRKIRYDQDRLRKRGRYARDCNVRYVWAREMGESGRQHYHVVILLNRDAYYTVGRLGSERVNMISRMEESWASSLGISDKQVKGLVHIPENAEYRVDRNVHPDDEDELPELFHRASYLCKAATKSYKGRQRGFGTSRGRVSSDQLRDR